MESFEAIPSKIRSPTQPHKILLKLDYGKAKGIFEKVKSEALQQWKPQLWKIEKVKEGAQVSIPSTKAGEATFDIIAKKFQYYVL